MAGEKLRQVRRLAGTEAAFLKEHAPGPWKITMPGAMSGAGPTLQAGRHRSGLSDPARPGVRHRPHDAQQEIAALHADGAAYIQLDSLHYVERVADTHDSRAHDRRGRGPGSLPRRSDRHRQRHAARGARRQA